MISLVGFIPSPRNGVVHIGPVALHAYGLMLALGILVALKIAERRWAARGHDPGQIGAIAMPVVIGGLVGARVYHLFTGYDWSKGVWSAPWRSGEAAFRSGVRYSEAFSFFPWWRADESWTCSH